MIDTLSSHWSEALGVSIAGNAIRPGVIRSGKSHRLLAEELLA